MTKKFSTLVTAVALAGTLGVFVGVRQCAFAQVAKPDGWTYTWTAPTTGSPVVKYAVEISMNGAVIDTVWAVGTTSIDIDVIYGSDYSVRVAGVDAADRWGPWSAPSVLETVEEDPPTNTSGAQ
jgi:hypothetical protein